MSKLTPLITPINSNITPSVMLQQQSTESPNSQAKQPEDTMTWSTCPLDPLPDQKTMRAMSRQITGGPKKKEDNFLQKGISTVGSWLGGGARVLGDRAGDAVADVVMNPLRLTPGGAFLPKNTGAGLLPGQKFVSEQARSAVRGVGEFGGSTVEGVADIAAHPLETAQGLVTLGSALGAQLPVTGQLQTATEALVRGKTNEQVRQDKMDTLLSVKDAIVGDFQANQEKIGLPGAIVKSGLDIFGAPKTAATVAPKLSRFMGMTGKLTDAPVPLARRVPPWLKMHKQNADELAAASVKLSPSELAQGRELIEGLDRGKGGVFHATSSDALAGLANTGELLPMNRLAERGVKRSSGEGTSMFAEANRGFVSLGEGREGLGSVLGYNDRMTKPPFSFGALSDKDLATESRRLSELAGDQAFSNFMPGIENQVNSRLNQVNAEISQRLDNPRQAAPYPVILGFKREGLELRPSSDVAGEMRVTESVSLKKNLESVMVPQKNMQEMAAYLERTLGPDHGVQMLPTETMHQLKPDFLDMHRSYVQYSNPLTGNHLDSAVNAYRASR